MPRFIPHLETTKKKISEIAKRKGFGKWMLGRKFSEKWRKNLSKAKMGNKNPSKRLEVRKKMSERRIKLFREGYVHPNWQGGISFEPYSVDWTDTLKKSIRERDHYICQLCNKPQGDETHNVHHIDYNKKNCNPNNLITLCRSCNAKVNFNRNYWFKILSYQKKLF